MIWKMVFNSVFTYMKGWRGMDSDFGGTDKVEQREEGEKKGNCFYSPWE